MHKNKMNSAHFHGAEIMKFRIGPKMGAQAMHC